MFGNNFNWELLCALVGLGYDIEMRKEGASSQYIVMICGDNTTNIDTLNDSPEVIHEKLLYFIRHPSSSKMLAK